MSFKNIFRIVVIVLFVAFVIQNTDVVEIRFLVWRADASRALVLICVFALGLLFGWLPAWVKGKKALKEDKKSKYVDPSP